MGFSDVRLAQATVGTLVAKVLTSATTNPYVTNPTIQASAPAALDAFSIQASATRVNEKANFWVVP
jgi:hypothetical protein